MSSKISRDANFGLDKSRGGDPEGNFRRKEIAS
jgi:hypothetical protein